MEERGVEVRPLHAIAHPLREAETLVGIVPEELHPEGMPLAQREVRTQTDLMGDSGIDTQVVDDSRGEGRGLAIALIPQRVGDVGAAATIVEIDPSGELLGEELIVGADKAGEALDTLIGSRLTLDIQDRRRHSAILDTWLTDELDLGDFAHGHPLQEGDDFVL